MRNIMILAAAVAALSITPAAAQPSGMSGQQILGGGRVPTLGDLQADVATGQVQAQPAPVPVTYQVPAAPARRYVQPVPAKRVVYPRPAWQPAQPQVCTTRVAPDGAVTFTGNCAAEIRAFQERYDSVATDDDLRFERRVRFLRRESGKAQNAAIGRAVVGALAVAAGDRLLYGRHGGYYGGSIPTCRDHHGGLRSFC